MINNARVGVEGPYAVLEISREAYEEITEKLNEAGHSEAFVDDLIDMHGIALRAEE